MRVPDRNELAKDSSWAVVKGSASRKTTVIPVMVTRVRILAWRAATASPSVALVKERKVPASAHVID